MFLLRSKRELLKIGFDHSLTLDSLINFPPRHFPLLRQAVGEHHHGLSCKEVKHPVVNTLVACSELVDAISQKVCLRPPQFMSQLSETIDPFRALGLYLSGQFIEPL